MNIGYFEYTEGMRQGKCSKVVETIEHRNVYRNNEINFIIKADLPKCFKKSL